MPGFVAEIGNNIKSNFTDADIRLVTDRFKDENYFLEKRTLNKFLNDKCFFQDENYIVILEGIILNKIALQKKHTEGWPQTIIQLYAKYGETFFKEFNGSFCGIFFDKKQGKWLIYTDHIGSKHVYYSEIAEKTIFATDINHIYGYFRNNELKCNLDTMSAYLLLSFGYMLEDYTLAKEIKKLMPGHYCKIENRKCSIHQYYQLTNTPNLKVSEADFIEEMDFHFKSAVKEQFEKDLEYSYKHLVGLSGGLDSRMTSWVAHDLGYTEQLNFTFSQSDYLDETIAKAIARDLNHEWIFKSLDGGNFLMNIDEISYISGGNVLYFGLAHQNSIYKLLNFEKYGILHSGQLGDVIFGTFYKSLNRDAKYKLGDGAYSQTFINKISGIILKRNYPNQEIFNFYNRGFSGANSGLLMPQYYTETLSPFYNKVLLEFALTIPLEFRFNHKIYHKWILKKYPLAATYQWEKINKRIDAQKIKIGKKEVYLSSVGEVIIKKLGSFVSLNKTIASKTKHHMNPIDYWLIHNNKLLNFFNQYVEDSIKLEIDNELRNDLVKLFKYGTGIEKIQVLTLLSAIRMYFVTPA